MTASALRGSAERQRCPIKIDEGVCGLASARFTPDGRHAITCCQFNIRLTVWNLLGGKHHYIDNPKHSEKGLDFDPDGSFMAVIHRKNFKDAVKLYSCRTWDVVNTWEVPSMDLADLKFSPNGRFICAWDNPLQYNLFVYSAPKGDLLLKYCAYEDALAIKTVAWSPNSMFLAVGSYDQRVRLINYLTWKPMCEYGHLASCAPLSTSSCTVYRETMHADEDISQYVVNEGPFVPHEVAPDPEKPNPKLGIGLMRWSTDSEYLATRNDNQPNCVYIWVTKTLSLVCILNQLLPVRSLEWNNTKPQLLVVTENARLFSWTALGAACVTIPTEGFRASSIVMNPTRDSLLLLDRAQAVACFNADERDE
ncbi:Translation initiation factor beta propellor-like domain-containing protein [Plasmodiophora brassicae]|uniref:Translation initiation factor beta propellor-like domain-containing protein n=1 Tax=Plasmodiophora brassicae TaxID=37360 RepID=A0A3P3Y7V8_PLABS|nr:unnamed protein product [Plasmodiophora brassicae]